MLNSRILLVVVVSVLGLNAVTLGQSQPDVLISFDKKECIISVDTGFAKTEVSFQFSEVQTGERTVSIGSRRLILGDSLLVGDRAVDLSRLAVVSVVQREGFYDIALGDVSSTARRGRADANRYASFSQLKLVAGDFVRGSALVVGGSLESNAEINGYVVALFGDIDLGSDATCHRDVLAVGGQIKRDRKARIYGAFQSTDSWRRSDIFKRRQRNYGYQPLAWSKGLAYNRVDGLTLSAGVAFQSEENFVPRFFAGVGYGASSNIWKYKLGFDHRFFDYHQLSYGGAVYRQTKTADEWTCSEGENTVYALLRREDFRDYYQGEGAELFVEQQINVRHTIRADYFIEVLDSLCAYPRLWSLAGGSKDFRSNFSSIPEGERGPALLAFTNHEAVLKLYYKYQSVVDPSRSAPQGWWLSFQYEHSSDAIASDFAYDRYTMETRRYQRLNEYLNINVRAIYGEIKGEAPLHRLYYLGGIRTLRGHKIKEYYGTEMGMLNIEIVINPYRTILDFAALVDVGGVGTKDRSLSESEWRGDFGAAVIVGELFRLELTRPFNGSDNGLQPSVLIGRSF